MFCQPLRSMLVVAALVGLSGGHCLAADKVESTKKLAGYTTCLIEATAVGNGANTNDLPPDLAQRIRDRLVEKLKEDKIFADVSLADAHGNPNSGTSQPDSGASTGGQHTLVVSSTINSFDKGSTAGRFFVGFGAGKAKIEVHFKIRDGQTGAEVLTLTQYSTYNGMTSFSGGDASEAAIGVANNVVKDFIKQIQRNR